MPSITPLMPLFFAAALLLAGNGLHVTLIALRADAEGFAPTLIGVLGTAFYVGFFLGTIYATRLIQSVGHIRVFAGLASVVATVTLVMVLFVDPYVWIGTRVVSGLCFAGLITVTESWLNSSAESSMRGRVLAIYSVVDLAAVTGSQLLLPFLGTDGYVAFIVTAMLYSLSLVPIALSPRASPVLEDDVKFDLLAVWRISPLAVVGCMVIGATSAAYRTVGPIYAKGIGLDVSGVALFMSAGIVGGAVLQMPLGWLSDKTNRRSVLIGATLGAVLAGWLLSAVTSHAVYSPHSGSFFVTDSDPMLIYGASFLFGAFALPLYSLSVAHAADYARPGQFGQLSAGLIFAFSLGAAIGPITGAYFIETLGPAYLFTFTSVTHLILIVWAVVRFRARPSVPRALRAKFTPLPRTSPAIFRLARRRLVRR